MAKEKNSVEKNYIYNLIYQMLVVVIPIVTTPYVSRVLNADGVGAYSFTSAVAGYFVLFGNLGVATYGQLRIAAFRNEKKQMSKIFYELFILRIVLMLIALIAFFIFIQFNNNLLYEDLYYILIIYIFATSFDISWFLQGLEEFKKIVLRNTLIKLLSVFLIFSLVKDASDLLLYSFIMNGSVFLGNASIWFFVPRYLQKVDIKELNIFH